MFEFSVIDKRTGEYPNVEKIALNEQWARHLIYCDIEGFAIDEDGNLILIDECGHVAYCPSDRFEVKIESGSLKRGKWINTYGRRVMCSECHCDNTGDAPGWFENLKYCPYCGAKMEVK